MKRSIYLFVSDILNSIVLIEDSIKNISNELKYRYEKIEWKKIAGMRDILIHAYFKVDLEAIWIVVKRDIPLLKENILNTKKDL